MGWLKLGHRQNPTLQREEKALKGSIEHIESISITKDSRSKNKYPLCDPSLPYEKLPFIDVVEVKRHLDTLSDGPWIVVDNVVFDCSDFVAQHPGGEQIINSFGGEECSWQFWRFHGEKEMNEFGLKLRIGRTNGLVNRYKEPIKYAGLRRPGTDDW